MYGRKGVNKTTILALVPVPACKKASLTLQPNEITIDMIAQVKKSPMHRLARLARIAGTARENFVNLGIGGQASNGSGEMINDPAQIGSRWSALMQGKSPGNGSNAGSTEEGENGSWIPPKLPLGPRTSNTSDDSSIATTTNEAMMARSTGSSKRDKYSKTRNPIQCLNPTQLQPPSSVLKAESLNTDPVAAAAAAKFENRKSLQRMFRFDANESESPPPPPFSAVATELETIFGSSPSTPTSFPGLGEAEKSAASAPHNGSATTK